jgi:EAL and modified HD-GYP domain-containing signal transduction protein
MIESPNSDIFLGRQPILDRDQNLVAYELLFRSGHQNFASFDDGRAATATVIRNLFSELSLGDVLGNYRGYINMDEDMLFSDTLELLPKESVVLEILETVRPTPQVVARCVELKARGFSLALDDVCQLSEPFAPLLPLVDVVKIDLKTTDPAQLAELARTVKQLGKKILAEKVDNREDMQRCHDLGFDLFQGYYFAKPVIIQGKKLDHSQLALLQLMNLVVSDAENSEIEAVFKQEPGLTINLLRLTNSVASGLPVRITSLRHAITLLGRRQLQRWLQLLLYTASAGRGIHPLLQLAATRGRLMELLAEKVAPNDKPFADNAFMAGILSLTPTLLNQAIEEIVAGLTLNREVHNALCEHGGQHGDLLRITELLENEQFEQVETILPRLPGLRVETINQRLVQALSWANNISREVD